VAETTAASTSTAPLSATDAALLSADSPALQQALERYQKTGKAPVIDQRTRVSVSKVGGKCVRIAAEK
jgi:hypothetical protein